MSFFSRYPIIADYEIQNTKHNVMDITRRTGIVSAYKNNPNTYIEYDVADGETPIILADRLYDDGDLFWVILYFNDILDADNEWPVSQDTLRNYINRVYDDPYGVHHYESLYSGAIVDSDWSDYDRVTITNTEFEQRKNDTKRKIKVPVPESIGNIINEHDRLISQ